MDVLRKHLLREGHLNKPELTEIISEATNILSKYISLLRYLYIFLCHTGKEPNVHRMKEPVIIVGDIHG